MKEQSMEWLAVVACTKKNFLENPQRYLESPSDLPPIKWAHAITEAGTTVDAMTEVGGLWHRGAFVGQQSDDEYLDAFLAGLSDWDPSRQSHMQKRLGPSAVKVLADPHAPKWLVLAACMCSGFLCDPIEYLTNPGARIQPHWACGVVRARTQRAASRQARALWELALFVGQSPDDELIDCRVAPLDGQQSGDVESEWVNTDPSESSVLDD